MRVLEQRFELTSEKVLLFGAPGLLGSVTVCLWEESVLEATLVC